MEQHPAIFAAETFVKTRLNGEGTGHDWWHAVRVRNTARTIQSQEGGDPVVVELAALLHDVGDRKVIGKDQDDYSIAENFLKQQDLNEKIAAHIMHIITNMSYSRSIGRENNQKESVELQIVQDADRLDALGAIGVARAFAYGGSRGRPLYDPEYSPQDFTSRDDYINATSSTLHHFDEKLYKLKDLLNTKTAKRIAENRDVYLREFHQRFIDEWNGKL